MATLSICRIPQAACPRDHRPPAGRCLTPIEAPAKYWRRRWGLKGMPGPGPLAIVDYIVRGAAGPELVAPPPARCFDHSGREQTAGAKIFYYVDNAGSQLEVHSWMARPGDPAASPLGRVRAWYYISTQPVAASGGTIKRRYKMVNSRTTKASTKPKARKPRGLTLFKKPFRAVATLLGLLRPDISLLAAEAALRELVEAEGGEYSVAESSLRTYLKDGRLHDKPTPAGWPRFQPAKLSQKHRGRLMAAAQRAQPRATSKPKAKSGTKGAGKS